MKNKYVIALFVVLSTLSYSQFDDEMSDDEFGTEEQVEIQAEMPSEVPNEETVEEMTEEIAEEQPTYQEPEQIIVEENSPVIEEENYARNTITKKKWWEFWK